MESADVFSLFVTSIAGVMQRATNLDEVGHEVPECHSGGMVFQFSREPIRQSSVAPNRHPYAVILSLQGKSAQDPVTLPAALPSDPAVLRGVPGTSKP